MNTLGTRFTRGFTIVELLIVVVVIAILAAITIVSYNGIINRASDSAAKSNLSTAATKLEIEKTTNSQYPLLLSDIAGGGITASPGTRIEYTSDGSTYCMTSSSIKAHTNYYQSNTSGGMIEGKCTDHTGYAGAEGTYSEATGSIFGTNPPPGNYNAYNDGSNTLWIGNRFYTDRNAGISVVGARVWEPSGASSGYLSSSITARAYVQDWHGSGLGGWNSLGTQVASATFSGTRTAGTWTDIYFATPITLPKLTSGAGPGDCLTIAIQYNGTGYTAADPEITPDTVESSQVSGVYLGEAYYNVIGRSVSNAYATEAAYTYYGLDLLFKPL